MIVKYMFGFASFGGPTTRQPTKQESVHIVLMVAIPFAVAALWQFVNAWCGARAPGACRLGKIGGI